MVLCGANLIQVKILIRSISNYHLSAGPQYMKSSCVICIIMDYSHDGEGF